ncbi:TonB-dependent receptor [Ferrovibrio sp.]|uniref:TonB-dependent receptor n=1 Tax=Ferrovibrio sp. TaxID=1917215 RepID=UPI00311EF1ED
MQSIRLPALLGGAAFLSILSAAAAQDRPAQLPAITVSADKAPEEANAPQENSLNLNVPASTGSRLGLTPMETPASVEIIPGATIRERGATSVNDAAARAVGFSTSASPGNGGTALSARGFSGHSSVVQLYDGTQFAVGAGTVTFPFDTWTLDRIEVLHGPASVMYGAGAVGGAVNVIPKAPNRTRYEHEAALSFGSDMTWHAAAGSGGPLTDRLSYRADVSRRQSDGWIDRGDSESLALSLALRADISDSFAVTLRNDYGNQEPMRYFGTPLVNGALDESLRKKNYNALDSVITYRDNWTQLKMEWEATDALTLTNTSYLLVSDRHWRNIEDYTHNSGSGLINRADYLEILHAQEQYGNRADASLENSLFGLRNQTTVGLDVSRIDFRHTNNSPYGGSSSVDPYSFDPGLFSSPDITKPKYDTDTTQYALFAEDRLSLTDRWSVVGGLRYDNVHMTREDLITASNGFSKTFANVTWRLGTVYDLTDTTAIYGQYATAVDPVGGIVTLSAASSAFTLATAEQAEIGVKQSILNGRGEWTLAGYHIVKHDLLSRDTANPNVTQQIGQQSSRGVELAFAFDLLENLWLEANASLLDARFDDFRESSGGVAVSRAGNTPSNVPERLANLWLTWGVAPDWKAMGGVQYVGETYSNNANTLKRPDYAVVDLGIAWSPEENTSVALKVFNIFDEVYAANAYGGDQWLLGRPRTAMLSTSIRF